MSQPTVKSPELEAAQPEEKAEEEQGKAKSQLLQLLHQAQLQQ